MTVTTDRSAPRDGLLETLKVTFLTVMPSPYVQDLFTALDDDARIELTVWYLEQEAPDTHWGEQAMPQYGEVLDGRWLGISGARVHYNPGIRRRIQASDADLFVIVGYIGLTNQLAMRELVRSKRPWVFWGEVPGLHQRGWLGRTVRSALQRPLRHCRGIAAVGQHAVKRYRALVEPNHNRCTFRNIPYHCRLNDFSKAAGSRRPSTPLRFLYCGQLIGRKGVDLLVQSMMAVLKDGYRATLTLVGTGPLRPDLEAAIPGDTRQHFHFAGFQEIEQLPRYFGDADVFVLPSRHDGWGVVVNQALAAGLPVIATTEVGAAVNLITHGENGFLVPPGDSKALTEVMQNLAASPPQVRDMQPKVAAAAEKISLACGVDDWIEFFHASLAGDQSTVNT